MGHIFQAVKSTHVTRPSSFFNTKKSVWPKIVPKSNCFSFHFCDEIHIHTHMARRRCFFSFLSRSRLLLEPESRTAFRGAINGLPERSWQEKYTLSHGNNFSKTSINVESNCLILTHKCSVLELAVVSQSLW